MKMPKTVLSLAMISLCALPPAIAQGRGHAGGSGGAGGPPMSTPPATSRGLGADRAPDIPASSRVDKPATPDPAARSAAPAAQALSNSMQSINQAAFAQRRELIGSVDMRLKASHEALKQIQAEAKASRADARADFKAALEEVKASEKAVTAATKAADRADEAAWENRRSALAAAMQRHDDAMNKLEAFRQNR